MNPPEADLHFPAEPHSRYTNLGPTNANASAYAIPIQFYLLQRVDAWHWACPDSVDRLITLPSAISVHGAHTPLG
jgi:hypothetical protein